MIAALNSETTMLERLMEKETHATYAYSMFGTGYAVRTQLMTMLWARAIKLTRDTQEAQRSDAIDYQRLPEEIKDALNENPMLQKMFMAFFPENYFCWFLHRFVVRNLFVNCQKFAENCIICGQCEFGPGFDFRTGKVDDRYVQGPKAGAGTVLSIIGEFAKQCRCEGGNNYVDFVRSLTSVHDLQHNDFPGVFQSPLFYIVFLILRGTCVRGAKPSEAVKKAADGLRDALVQLADTAVCLARIFSYFCHIFTSFWKVMRIDQKSAQNMLLFGEFLLCARGQWPSPIFGEPDGIFVQLGFGWVGSTRSRSRRARTGGR